MKLIKSAKKIRSVEAFLELFVKILGISIVYVGFNSFVQFFLEKNLEEETLLSLLLLPLLYILKDIENVIDPFTVIVEKYEDKIVVTRGFTPKVKDSLEFKNVENIEIITSLFGIWKNYSTIRLYSPGGLVEMPYIYKAEEIVKNIEELRNNLNNNNDV